MTDSTPGPYDQDADDNEPIGSEFHVIYDAAASSMFQGNETLEKIRSVRVREDAKVVRAYGLSLIEAFFGQGVQVPHDALFGAALAMWAAGVGFKQLTQNNAMAAAAGLVSAADYLAAEVLLEDVSGEPAGKLRIIGVDGPPISTDEGMGGTDGD